MLREFIGLVELPLQHKPRNHDKSTKYEAHHRGEKEAGRYQDAGRYDGDD